jgi:hypothetical protein
MTIALPLLCKSKKFNGSYQNAGSLTGRHNFVTFFIRLSIRLL